MRMPEHGCLRRKDNGPRWADADSPHNTDKRDHSEDPHAPYPTSLRRGSVLLCNPSSLLRARSCPLGWCRPALTRFWFAVFGLAALFPTCCHPTSEKGVFVLCVTCIGELGPTFGALSQEGSAGLERTVDWFDSERGLRDRGRAIRLPLHEREKGRERKGRQGPCRPRDAPRRTRTRHRRWGTCRTPRLGEEVEVVLSVPAGPTCLDRPVGPADEDSAEPGAVLAASMASTTRSSRAACGDSSAITSVALEGALHGLTQPEQTVIVLRHGIGGRQAKSLRTSPRISG
jgi:hypothetical protein